MSDLFELSMPWWEFVLRAAVVYVVLLTLVRLSGKRTMGQFTPFDMLLVVLLGTAVQNSLIGEDTSLGGGLLLAAVLICFNWVVAFVTSRNKRAERLVEGVPVVLARDGKLFRDVLKRELVSRDDFDEALRCHGEMTLADVRIALLETNGTISVIKYDSDDDNGNGKALPDSADATHQAGAEDASGKSGSSDTQSRGDR